MKERAVLFAAGRDRVGVVDDLGAALDGRHLSILDSRMTSLGGRFSLIIEVRGDDQDVKRLQDELSRLSRDLGFGLQLDRIARARATPRPPGLVIESFTAEPASLNALTGLLKRRNVNIEELTTEASEVAFDCEPSFHMMVRVTVPPDLSVAELTAELRELERERDLDIVIRS